VGAGGNGVEGLSPRLREVLRLISEGRADKEIAVSLRIALPTVKAHVRTILDVLACPNRAAAAALYGAWKASDGSS
jgi:DNA-binding NarL/FixJ family response regulator